MITITCYCGNEVVAEAESDTPEGAVLAARTLWDEAWNGWQGCKRRLIVSAPGLVLKLDTRP